MKRKRGRKGLNNTAVLLFPLINKLYQPKWASHHKPQPQLLWQFLPEAGLNIEQDLADAKTLNVRKTPEFFVNGKPLPSFGYDQLIKLVGTELQANY
jgi:hypothetical protein